MFIYRIPSFPTALTIWSFRCILSSHWDKIFNKRNMRNYAYVWDEYCFIYSELAIPATNINIP